jgi:Fic family protein
MSTKLHTFLFSPDWKLINELSELDKFGGSWTAIEKREGRSLKQLKSVATVRSVGASTRIEGSRMTDDEVEVFLRNISVSKLEDRDKQEVAGYFEAMDVISESFSDITISESGIKNLHNILLKHSKKDEWHRGKYKQHSNMVEATQADGSKQVIFQTTEPGFPTEDAMRKLIDWYHNDSETHPIVRSAVFVYDFLSIHPFQDGNGRLSRLLAMLLLLKQGYSWIHYVSFEHEIESRKVEYYKTLMLCQGERPGEDIYPWVIFFLDCMNNIQQQLMDKLIGSAAVIQLPSKEKVIYLFIESNPGCSSGEIAEKLGMVLSTVKKILADMVIAKLIVKHGVGRGTHYSL